MSQEIKLLLISIGIVLLGGAIWLLFKASSTNSHYRYIHNEQITPYLESLLKLFGQDVEALLPETYKDNVARDTRLTKLLKDSNNPWGVTPSEFVLLKFVLLPVGIVFGLVVGIIVYLFELSDVIIMVAPFLFGLVAFYLPTLIYKSAANYRLTQYKLQLPEAIDYLGIALSGGQYSLSSAIEEVSKYLPNGVIRDEFTKMVNDLHSGQTVETTLLAFSDRSPSEGVKAFCQALINANKLSVPVTPILEARSEQSRLDLESEISQNIESCKLKIDMLMTVIMMICVMIVSAVPAVFTIIKNL